MPQLDYSTYFSQIFWLFIIFTLIFLFVNYYVHPKISSVLRQRTIKIEDAVRFAKQAQMKIEQNKRDYTESVSRLKSELAVQFDKSFAQVKQEELSCIEEFNQHSRELIARAKKDISNQHKAAITYSHQEIKNSLKILAKEMLEIELSSNDLDNLISSKNI